MRSYSRQSLKCAGTSMLFSINRQTGQSASPSTGQKDYNPCWHKLWVRSSSHPEAKKMSAGRSELTDLPHRGNHSFQWVEPPRTVLLVKKPHDAKASKAMGDIITSVYNFSLACWTSAETSSISHRHLHADYSNMNIVVERPVSEEFGQQFPFLITFDPCK